MKLQAFVHRHYSAAAGESPVAHIAAVLAGIALIGAGGVLVASVVVVPLGTVVGLLGVMLLGAGLLAHIQSPVTFGDAMDALVGLTGAAIAMMFALVAGAFALGLVFTALFELFQWMFMG